VFIAGGACGGVKGGRHVKCPEDTPMTNLLATTLVKAGLTEEHLGDSTGLLSEV
jgi:hypothetical protein